MSGTSTPRDASPYNDPPSPSTAAPRHPAFAGKSLEALQRPRYKSWRKKYRKMHVTFNATLETNKQLFKDEAKLESVLRRLQEERDGLLDMLLDFNNNPAVPPELRFDLSIGAEQAGATPKLPLTLKSNSVAPDITPEQANDLLAEYASAVQAGQIPPLDLHIVRGQIEERLAVQDTKLLSKLEDSIPHPELPAKQKSAFATELHARHPLSYFTTEAETDYLARLDQKSGDPYPIPNTSRREVPPSPIHISDLTPRELERRVELENPLSQHNWLLKHTKMHALGEGEDEITSFASHEPSSGPKRKRGERKNGPAKTTLQRTALERARESHGPPISPSAASFFDDDDTSMHDEPPSSTSRKRGGDPDKTFRVKAAKSAGGTGGGKGKRKRIAVSGDGDHGGSVSKKVRTSEPAGNA